MDLKKFLEITYRTGDGAFAVDRHPPIVFWNSGAEQTLGCPHEGPVGEQCFKITQGMTEDGQANCFLGCPNLSCSISDNLVRG